MTPEEKRAMIAQILAGGGMAPETSPRPQPAPSDLRRRQMMDRAMPSQGPQLDPRTLESLLMQGGMSPGEMYGNAAGNSAAGAGPAAWARERALAGNQTARAPFDPLEALSASYRAAGESFNPAGYKGAGESAALAKNRGSYGVPLSQMFWGDMTEDQKQQWRDGEADRQKMGYGIDKEFKRADMSGLTDDARQQYLRQSFVAPGQFPDRGMNGGPGGGIEMLRQLYMQQSRPIWLQDAINNGDFDPELLDRIARGG